MSFDAESALLPNEPRVVDAPRQHALSERFLLPARSELETLFRAIRTRLDPVLSAVQPTKWGKPYPLGQCLEISLAVKRELRLLNPATLAGAAAHGHAALAGFLQHGGLMHQVWGDLRGEYFQNAFLAGTIYIDVSNDTVVSSKPPVEILPLAETRFVPVADFQHFARIASRYWRATLHANHLLPALAPYYPFIAVIPGAGIRLEADSGYMVMLAQRLAFSSSLAVLDSTPLDVALFDRLADRLVHASPAATHNIAATPVADRVAAILNCKAYANGLQILTDLRRVELGAAIAHVNRCWAGLGEMV